MTGYSSSVNGENQTKSRVRHGEDVVHCDEDVRHGEDVVRRGKEEAN